MQELLHEFIRQAIQLAPRLLAGIGILLGFAISAWAVKLLIKQLIRRTGRGQQQIVRLAQRLATMVIMTFGLVTALGTMGINVSALVAGLGLTGFALGFALRDALSNLLAGVLLILYGQFRVGDHIEVAGMHGVVRDVNLRYTLLAWERRWFMIPNSILFTNAVTLVEEHLPARHPQERETALAAR